MLAEADPKARSLSLEVTPEEIWSRTEGRRVESYVQEDGDDRRFGDWPITTSIPGGSGIPLFGVSEGYVLDVEERISVELWNPLQQCISIPGRSWVAEILRWESRSITIWDLETRQEVEPPPGHSDDVKELVFSADGSRVCSLSHDKSLATWDLDSGEMLAKTVVGPYPCGLATLEEGRLLCSSSGFLRVEQGQVRALFEEGPHPHFGLGVRFDVGHQNAMFRSDQFDASELVWLDLESGVHSTRPVPHELWAFAASAELNDAIFVVYDDPHLYRLRRDTPEFETITRPGFRPWGVAWHRSRNWFAVSWLAIDDDVRESLVEVTDASSGAVLHSFRGTFWNTNRFSFDPTGRFLIGGGSLEGTCDLFDLERDAAFPRAVGEHDDVVHALAWSPDGRRFATGSDDARIRSWRMPDPVNDEGAAAVVAWIEAGGGSPNAEVTEVLDRWEKETGFAAEVAGGEDQIRYVPCPGSAYRDSPFGRTCW